MAERLRCNMCANYEIDLKNTQSKGKKGTCKIKKSKGYNGSFFGTSTACKMYEPSEA